MDYALVSSLVFFSEFCVLNRSHLFQFARNFNRQSSSLSTMLSTLVFMLFYFYLNNHRALVSWSALSKLIRIVSVLFILCRCDLFVTWWNFFGLMYGSLCRAVWLLRFVYVSVYVLVNDCSCWVYVSICVLAQSLCVNVYACWKIMLRCVWLLILFKCQSVLLLMCLCGSCMHRGYCDDHVYLGYVVMIMFTWICCAGMPIRHQRRADVQGHEGG